MSIQSRSDLFKLFDQLNAKSYHINPFYIEIAGSVTAGYLLTQLIFLSRSFAYEPFYRTDNVLRAAYKLGQKELMGARNKLIAAGLISIQRLGVPARLYYTINIDRIIELAIQLPAFQVDPAEDSSYAKREQLDVPKGHNRKCQNGITIKNKLHNDLENKNKENIKRKSPLPTVADTGEGEIDNGFEEFYKRYPVKKAKPKAKQAYNKAIKSTSLEQILNAIENQGIERNQKARVGAFVPEWPYPTTWLNQERWNDSTQSQEQIERMAPKGKTRQQERNDAFKVTQSLMERINNRVPQIA